MRETIEIDEKGVYLVKTAKLSPRQIADKRKRIESRIAYYYRTNQEHADLIERNKKRIQNLETQRTELNDPMVTSIINAYVEKRRFAQMKAEEFLEEFLGQEVYDKLKKNRYITFLSKDKQTYKIDLKGFVYRKRGSDFERLCLIRPKDLPLPDFITSAITTVKEQPHKFTRR